MRIDGGDGKLAIKLLKTWYGGLTNNGQVRCLQALTAAWQKLPQSAINFRVGFEDVSYLLQIGAVN